MQNQREQFLFNQGVELFNKNALTKSLVSLEDAISLNPNNAEAYFYIGNIYHIQGKLGKAVKSFNKVLDIEPGHTDASISLSVILNDIGRYEDAKKIFDQADKKVKSEKKGLQDPHINKKFAAKHFEIAEMYFSYNRYEEALSEYNKSSGLNPEDLEVRIKIARVYAKKGYVAKAFEELRKLKSECPNFVPVRIALGLLHYSKGNAVEAQTEWQAALTLDPRNDEVQMYMKLSQGATETNLVI